MNKNYDFLNYKDYDEIGNLFKNENVMFTGKITKIGSLGIRGDIVLLITNKNICLMKNHKRIKRKAEFKNIKAISISNLSHEFVIHFNNDYDMRLSSHDLRNDIIICILLNVEKELGKEYLEAYYLDSINLNNVTTTQSNFNSKKIKKLNDKYLEKLNYKKFLNKNNIINERKTILKGKTKTLLKLSKNEKDICMDDFDLIKVLGKGAFGKVVLAEKIDNKKLYAIKILKKNEIIETDQVEHTKAEKLILTHVNHPFLVNLDYCFQSDEKIYFVIQFMKGGEMFQHMAKARKFTEERTKFYAACIILAIGHLHNKNYIYRDLKLENLLLDENGYCKLTDFGLAKFITNQEKALTFCGTPEYLAPEVILGEGHNRPADWWSLGILTYEMMYGLPPFYTENTNAMFRKIVKDEIKFNSNITVSEEGKDFIKKLLNKDQKTRLGSQGDSLEMMSHPWFKGLDWNKLISQKIPAPFIPDCEGNNWINNFDEEFTREEVRDTVVGKVDLEVLKQIQSEIKKEDFDYNKDKV